VLDRLALGVGAGEGGEEAGVDVDDPPRVGGEEGRREEAHVAGQADPFDPGLDQGVEDPPLVTRPVGLALMGDRRGRQPKLAGPLQARGVGDVAHHQGDLGRQLALGDGGLEGEEVAPPAGEEDPEAGRAHSASPMPSASPASSSTASTPRS